MWQVSGDGRGLGARRSILRLSTRRLTRVPCDTPATPRGTYIPPPHSDHTQCPLLKRGADRNVIGIKVSAFLATQGLVCARAPEPSLLFGGF